MTKREQMETLALQANNNGITKAQMLTQTQVAQLQQMLLPLVALWKESQALITGFMAGAGIKQVRYSIDLNTGIVSLVQSVSSPTQEPEPEMEIKLPQ